MNKPNKKKISLDQRSDEWHAFRAQRIGGSDAAVICGVSPWKDIRTLWLEKSGQVEKPEFKSNWAIDRGVRLEPMVNGLVCIHLDRDFEPAIYVHPEKDHIMASFDGIDEAANEAIEIKVGNRKDHEALISSESTPQKIIVPEKYYSQMQQQMYVADLEWLYYCSYYLPKGVPEDRGDLKIVKVFRDDPFLHRYIQAADEFMECVRNKTEPRKILIKA